MDLTNWRSQIRKGLIEFCLLGIIQSKEQAYGLELLEGLRLANLEVSEGTLYPLLSRLVREKYLEPKWVTPKTGNPRKYYRLSSVGEKILCEMKKEWDQITLGVDEVQKNSILKITNGRREDVRSEDTAKT